MDKNRKIAILLFLHVRRESSKLEESEIAEWRAESSKNEMLYLQLTNMEWVVNYIRDYIEGNKWMAKLLKEARPYFNGVKMVGEPSFIPPKKEWPVAEKTLQELHEENLAKWPYSKLQYWIHEMETDETYEFTKKTTVRKYFEYLLEQAGLLKYKV